jgi:hypothetical protein
VFSAAVFDGDVTGGVGGTAQRWDTRRKFKKSCVANQLFQCSTVGVA